MRWKCGAKWRHRCRKFGRFFNFSIFQFFNQPITVWKHNKYFGVYSAYARIHMYVCSPTTSPRQWLAVQLTLRASHTLSLIYIYIVIIYIFMMTNCKSPAVTRAANECKCECASENRNRNRNRNQNQNQNQNQIKILKFEFKICSLNFKIVSQTWDWLTVSVTELIAYSWKSPAVTRAANECKCCNFGFNFNFHFHFHIHMLKLRVKMKTDINFQIKIDD